MEAAGGTQGYVFRGTGYKLWAAVAEGKLRERSLFRFVQGKFSGRFSDEEWEALAAETGDDIEEAREKFEDGKSVAFAALAMMIDRSVLVKFPNTTDPAELWQAIRWKYENADASKRTDLYRRLASASSRDYKTLGEYVSAIEATVSQLEAAGMEVKEEETCFHLLKGLDPVRYQAFLDGMEARDTDTMTFDWLAGKIRNLERTVGRHTSPQNTAWRDGTRQCRTCGGEWHRQCPRISCYNCQGKGHIARDCPQSGQRGSQNFRDRVNWVLDSGASASMTNDESELTNIEYIPTRRIMTASGQEMECQKKGSLLLETREGNKTIIEDVLIVPDLKQKLISVKSLQNCDYQVTFGKDGCRVLKNGNLAFETREGDGGLYEVECLMARLGDPKEKTDTLRGWHKRLGHLSQNKICELVKEGHITGVRIQGNENLEDCAPCAEGKQTDTRHEKVSERTPEKPGEIVSADVVGPIRPLGAKNQKYISVMMDHYTGWISAKPMTCKSTEELMDHAEEVTAFLKTQTGESVRILRTDSAPEYLTDRFEQWILKQGMVHETTAPYSPASNGKVERLNRTISECVRTQMACSHLDCQLWPYAAVNAAYLLNRTLISPYTRKTPYQSVFGVPPNVCDLVAFGTPCHVMTEGPRPKLSPKSREGIALGRKEGQEGQYVLVQGSGVIVSRNIQEIGGRNTDARADSQDNLEIEEEENLEPSDEIAGYAANIKNEDCPEMEEALNSEEREEWLVAIEAELRNILDYDVVEKTTPHPDDKPLRAKIVLNRKRGPDGAIVRYKARLVALGCGQRPGKDYGETFAPVCREETIRVLLHVAASKGLHTHQLDIDAAYLNAPLQERIVIEMPRMFRSRFCGPNETLRLKKALYGLKQAGSAWYAEIRKTLKELGWTQGKVDPCLFTRMEDSETEYLALYVDDIVLATPSKERTQAIKGELGSRFALKDVGDLQNLLGMHIVRKDRAYQITQPKMLRGLIGEGPEAEYRSTPMTRSHLSIAEVDLTRDEKEEYQAMTGTLLYLSRKSRPDIAHAVGILSRSVATPTQRSMKDLRWLMGYVRYTADYQMVIRGGGMEIQGWTDASFAEDGDRKSTSGHVIKIGHDTIAWGSKRQSVVATSTLEAEYVAMSECARTAKWVRMLLEHDFGEKPQGKTRIFCDNKGAIEVARNPTHHFRSKHIDIKFHHVREMIEEGEIDLVYVSSESNVADVMTKPLNKSNHHNHRAALGLIKASGGVLNGMP